MTALRCAGLLVRGVWMFRGEPEFFYEEGGLDVGIEEPAPLDTFAETQVASAAPDGVSSATRGV